MRGKGKRGQQARGKTTLVIQSFQPLIYSTHQRHLSFSLRTTNPNPLQHFTATPLHHLLGGIAAYYICYPHARSLEPSPAIMAAETSSIMDQLDTTTLVSLSAVLVILFSSYGLSLATLASDTPKRLRVLFIWHFFDFLIHSIFEGSFLCVPPFPIHFPLPPLFPSLPPAQ
jgi:hypothetical protein